MPFTYDSDTARPFLSAKKVISIDFTIISMTKREGPFVISKRIEPVGIKSTLVRNDFNLAIACFKEVVLHGCSGLGHTIGACADADGFCTVSP